MPYKGVLPAALSVRVVPRTEVNQEESRWVLGVYYHLSFRSIKANRTLKGVASLVHYVATQTHPISSPNEAEAIWGHASR